MQIRKAAAIMAAGAMAMAQMRNPHCPTPILQAMGVGKAPHSAS
jgi:hypothetical protein